MTVGLSPQWMEVLSLSNRDAPELYLPGTLVEGSHAQAITFAINELGLAAVFCIEGVPTIGFLNAANISSDRVDTIHRILWNQGLMSLLLVVRQDDLLAYSLVRRPFLREQGTSAPDPRLITTLSLINDALRLRELIGSTQSGRFWFENDAYFNPDQRVDSVLLSNLLQSFRELKDELGSDAAQALLMQAMFIAYLEDRKIIKSEVFSKASSGIHSSFAEMLEAKTTTSFEALFVWLKAAFNGNVFNAPCAFDVKDVSPPKLKTKHLKVLARFRHGREEMTSGQTRLFGYDFEYMSIGLISAVYDRFLKEEAEKANSDGAFYTPMFLADIVVNQLWDDLSEEQRAVGVFCDPACGSGIFLVRLFQRLVANHCRQKKKRYATWNELKSIARRLHGADINPAAVRVAAFSLYITLLEQSNPPDLPTLIEAGKLLPPLYGDTLRPSKDFFTMEDDGHYDAVVGNPPWKGRAGSITTAQQWTKSQNLPDPAKDIAWGFIWKSLRVLKPRGLVALLLPAMGVLHNNDSGAARKLLLQKAKIRRIVNLSDLCFQLFDGAQRPTAFILYENISIEGEPYHFEYWVPKADLNLRLKRMMTLSRSDRILFRSDIVGADTSLFKRRLWSRSPDEKLLQFLRTVPPLSGFVNEYKKLRDGEFNREKTWAIGQGFQPAQQDKIGKKGYGTTTSDVVTRYPYLSADAFCPVVLPEIKAKPWNSKTVRRAGFGLGFEGPHILIPQGVERSKPRLRASYTDQSLVFEDSLQAIAFPPAKRRIAKLLTAVLNSSLAAWYYFHDTANFGADRAKVHQKDVLKLPFSTPGNMPDPKKATSAAKKIVRLLDREIKHANDLLRDSTGILDEIDQLVFSYYNLDESDIALVEDTFRYILPAIQPRRNAGLQLIWNNSRPEHRKLYAAMLCNSLKPWFHKPITASLAANSADIAILRLSISDESCADQYSEAASTELRPFLEQIADNLKIRLPGNVHVMPDLRFVIGQDMYLVKPLQLRHWLRPTALADAEQIAAEFSSVIVQRGNKSTDQC